MCGIYGWIPRKGSTLVATMDVMGRMGKKLQMRGPDDAGVGIGYCKSGKQKFTLNTNDLTDGQEIDVAIGQNRLSIIDLSEKGHQPMVDRTGRFVLVFNGEIYNYRELRKELEALGRHFVSNSDSEVLLQAYAEWGKDSLRRFVGMFAFAVYDLEIGEIFCARDAFGIKPFYHQENNNGFSFASELPALFEVPGTSRRINDQKVFDYLSLCIMDNGTETMVSGISQLEPAQYMRFDVKTGSIIEVKTYWSIDLNKRTDVPFIEAAATVRRIFLDSVRLHLRSDVPLGVALSGGIDSSAVACAIRALEPDMQIKTFSYIAADSIDLNEEKWIDIVNERIGAIPYKTYVKSSDLIDDIDSLIERLGEPFGGTSIYAQRRVYQLVKDAGVKVTLDGQGADEMLAGYIGFPHERIETLIRQGHFIEAVKFFHETTKWPGRTKKKVFFGVIGKFVPSWLVPLGRWIIGMSLVPKFVDPKWLRDEKVRVQRAVPQKRHHSRYKLLEVLAVALTQQGLPTLLRNGDRNSMTFSIESRVPFLTTEMAEYLLSLPEEYLVDASGRTKAVFRESMRGIVPDEILDRRDKIGFATPEHSWLNEITAWVEGTIEYAKDSNVIQYDELRKMWDDVLQGRIGFDTAFWRCLNYLRWRKKLGIQET